MACPPGDLEQLRENLSATPARRKEERPTIVSREEKVLSTDVCKRRQSVPCRARARRENEIKRTAMSQSLARDDTVDIFALSESSMEVFECEEDLLGDLTNEGKRKKRRRSSSLPDGYGRTEERKNDDATVWHIPSLPVR
jgi:hypothetical protein